MKLSKKDRYWLNKAIAMMSHNAVFLHSCGNEKLTFRYLFLIEEFKDLLEKK